MTPGGLKSASIIICTLNRAHSLEAALESVSRLSVPEGLSVELLIIDNGSTDDTAEVVRRQSPKFPIRYILEPQRGLSNARNRGVAEAVGSILLFTDDDVRLPEDWLRALCEPIIAGRAHAVSGGAEMAPHLRRTWMTPRHRGFLACGAADTPREKASLLGASMAVSRTVFERVPRFDSEIGPGRLGFYEDALFSWQVAHAGYRIAVVDGVVEHHFDEKRLLSSSFVDHARKMGRSSAYVAYHWAHKAVRMPMARLAACAAKLGIYRIFNGSADAEGCSEREMSLTEALHFYRQYLVERKRPRNYSRCGLVKISG